MRDMESYVEYLRGLFTAQFNDCAVQYPTLTKEFNRDLIRLSSAIDSHGIRFILDVMPSWRKHLDRCLSQGRLTLSHMPHFGGWKKGGVHPRFLRGLTLRVFDLNGELKPDADVQAVRLLRQLLGVGRRFRVACGPRACSDAVREFVSTDLSVRSGDLDWYSAHNFVLDASRVLSFTDLTNDNSTSNLALELGEPEVSHIDYRHLECIQQVADRISVCLGLFDPLDAKFQHGPGAVSDRKFGTHKYAFTNWPDRLDSVFPMADFATANYDHWMSSSLYLSPDASVRREHPAKLIAVPKTIKTPRLIAAEPLSFQWCQQGIRHFLYRSVASSMFSAFVDFRRQDRNGQLALDASQTGLHCTIDLSSASDRISCWHVERLFRRSPALLDALRASRSLFIEQDISRKSPRYHILRKYSTMGNATTFPVQSLFFLAVALGSLFYARSQKVTTSGIKALGEREVLVFGDDIIIPKDCVVATIGALTALGLRVNPDKTFTEGNFRESCGVDAFRGEDVTTVSVLSAPKRAKPGTIVSSVDVHNNLCSKGYYRTAAFIRKTVDGVGRYKIPSLQHGSGSFGWYPNYISVDQVVQTRFNTDIQVRESRCHHLSVKAKKTPSNDSAALLQFFSEAASKVTSAISSLYYHSQRAQPSLRLGWVVLEGPVRN